MRKCAILLTLALFFGISLHAHAQIVPGWYYDEVDAPRYYYANGVYYDPASQSYGGSVLYPNEAGPQINSAFTPGVPNTGAGGTAFYAWLALIVSAGTAVAGTYYLTRNAP